MVIFAAIFFKDAVVEKTKNGLMEVLYYDVTGWEKMLWDTPAKGTRPNRFVEKPETGELYFFKESKKDKTGEKTLYPSEIWSEIIASKVGQLAQLKARRDLLGKIIES